MDGIKYPFYARPKSIFVNNSIQLMLFIKDNLSLRYHKQIVGGSGSRCVALNSPVSRKSVTLSRNLIF